MSDTTVVARGRWGRIPKPPEKACGLGRGSIYKLAKTHRGLLKKFGAASLLDLDLLAEIVAGLPDADLSEDNQD
jgi:hypothetical protein